MAKSFAMYTQLGDEMVGNIVDLAQRNRWNWPMTYAALEQLSRNHPNTAGEATDTEVRVMVYDTLKFDTPFYC